MPDRPTYTAEDLVKYAAHGDEAAVRKALASKQVHVDAKTSKSASWSSWSAEGNIVGQTALVAAATNGKLGMVELLVKQGKADLDQPNAHGDTALHAACLSRSYALAIPLVKLGANPMITNRSGTTAIAAIARRRTHTYNSPSTVGILNAFLVVAAKGGNCAALVETLKHGAEVNHADETGWTALHHACLGDQGDAVACLVQAGADIEVKTAEGDTPLIVAKANNCKAAASALKAWQVASTQAEAKQAQDERLRRTLTEQNNALKEQLTAKSTKLTVATNTVTQLDQELKTCKKQLATAEAAVKTLEAGKAAAEQQAAELQERMADMTANATATDAVAKAQAIVARLESKLADAKTVLQARAVQAGLADASRSDMPVLLLNSAAVWNDGSGATKKGDGKGEAQAGAGSASTQPTYEAVAKAPSTASTATSVCCMFAEEKQEDAKPEQELDDSQQWLGIVRMRPDSVGLASLAAPGTDLAAVREKIAADAMQLLSGGAFLVPEHRLALLPLVNEHTKGSERASVLQQVLSTQAGAEANDDAEVLFLLRKDVEDVKALDELFVPATTAGTSDEKATATPLLASMLDTGAVPEAVMLGPSGDLVPLVGLVELLAVARLLGDTDVIGRDGTNVGVVPVIDASGNTIAVQAVKLDAGSAFNFSGGDNRFVQWFSRFGPKSSKSADARDIQLGNTLARDILWSKLSGSQQQRFLASLSRGLMLLSSTPVRRWLAVRGGEFNAMSSSALVPEDATAELEEGWLAYLAAQREAFDEELSKTAGAAGVAPSTVLAADVTGPLSTLADGLAQLTAVLDLQAAADGAPAAAEGGATAGAGAGAGVTVAV